MFIGLTLTLSAQTAPSHLKYFGFTAIDCFYDDPLDASSVTNYVTEVDSFSNIAHMCVYDYTDNIVARTTFMNSNCVNPILHIQEIFFEYVDTIAPSGANYDLRPNYASRWATFVANNSSVLLPANIGCFYIADEPFWCGISLAEMDTVCTLVKSTFPTIPLLMVEAYTTVNVMQVPQLMDWVGFDRYGSFDPQFDPAFIENMDTLKSRLSAPHQKIVLIIDDQWFPDYFTFLGWTQDTMADVVQNYYDLAVSDTSIIGLIGYIWPGGLDGATHHGVRNLTPAVINKNVEIGQMIKANYSPCSVGLDESAGEMTQLRCFPNPVKDILTIELVPGSSGGFVTLFNSIGQPEKVVPVISGNSVNIPTADFPSGLYFVVFQDENTQRRGTFVISH